MNDESLRIGMRELLSDIRTAGRGAFASTYDHILEMRLPSLVAAHDLHANSELPSAFRDRLSAAVRSACNEAAAGAQKPTRDLPWAWNLLRDPRPLHLAFAGASVLLLIASVWIALRPSKETWVAPKEKPGITGPNSPVPPRPNSKPSGPMVRKEPEIEIRTSPQLGSGSQDNAQRLNSQPGEFTLVQGDVFVRSGPTGRPVLADLRTKVPNGSIIETGDSGAARIASADGSSIQLGVNSVCEQIGSRHFAVTKGDFAAKVARTASLAKFTVETPAATAEVLGTQFSLHVDKVDRQKTRAVLQVRSGRVAFANDLARVEATAMTESTAISGAAPSPPVRIRLLRDFPINYGQRHIHLRQETAQLTESAAEGKWIYPRGWAGLSFGAKRNGGVRIVDVIRNSPGMLAGLHLGESVITLNGVPVRRLEEVQRAIFLGAGKTLELTVEREGISRIVRLKPVTHGSSIPHMPARNAERLQAATRRAIEGDVDGALRVLHEWVAREPTAAVHNNLAAVYEMRDDMANTIRHYRAAVELDPGRPLYHLNLGLALQKIGKTQRAIEEIRTALKLNPDFRDAYLSLADAFSAAGLFDEAVGVLRQACQRYPRVSRFWIRMTRILIRAGRFAPAVEAGNRAVQIDPESFGAHAALGEALTYAGDSEGAIQECARAIELNPFQPVGFWNLSRAYETLRLFDESEKALRQAVELDPMSARFHNDLGRFLAKLGRIPEAVAEYEHALQLDPGRVMAYVNLGNLEFFQGKRDEAIEVFLKLIKIEPDFGDGHAFLGATLLRMGRLREAEVHLSKAAELEPVNPFAFRELGILYAEARDSRRSEAMFRRAIDLGCLDGHLFELLGRLRADQKQYREAENLLRRALELNPRDPRVHLGLGTLLLELGRPEEAIFPIRDAIDLGERSAGRFNGIWQIYGKAFSAADAWVALGQTYEALKDVEQAKNAYSRALGFDAKNPVAIQGLIRLSK